MPSCPKCGTEYREGAPACPECWQPLLAVRAQVSTVAIYDAPNAIWADAVKAALRKAGITVTERLCDRSAQRDSEEAPVYSELRVPESRVVDARWAVASFLSGHRQAPEAPRSKG
jgi:hypothetical protein